jgi:hypothetical protein
MKVKSVVRRVTTSDILWLAGYTPPTNSNRLIRCPIHGDTIPSLRVFERGFRCFGCGRRGGLLDLVVDLGFAGDRAGAARWLETRFR